MAIRRLNRNASRVQRPAEMDYLANIGKRIKGNLIAARMDMIGSTGSQPRKPYMVAERIAIIEIYGLLCNDACWWDETDYAEIQYEIEMARDDADVDGILCIFNTPGGETDSAFETADLLKQAGSVKPIWGVAAPSAYSAGYLLLCQCQKIYVPPITGGVGSIGVFCLHFDYSEFLKKAGIAVTIIAEGTGKTDGNPYQPLSPEANVKIVAEIQRLYGEFVSRVASGRNMGESAIIKLGAGLFDGGKAAMGAGLADLTGSVESAWTELATRVAQAKLTGISMSALAERKGELMETPTPATGAAAPVVPVAAAAATGATPEQVAKLTADASAAGFGHAAEIVELCAIAGKPEKAAAYIRDRKPLADVRKDLLEAKAEKTDANATRNGVLASDAANSEKPKKSMKEMAQERYGVKS